MSVDTAIIELVEGSVDLNNLIGGRIYPVTVPQEKSLPAITYEVVSNLHTISKDGDSGIRSYRVQFDILVPLNQRSKIIEITEALYTAINIFSPAVYGGTTILVAHAEDTEIDDYDDETKTLIKRLDFLIKTRQ